MFLFLSSYGVSQNEKNLHLKLIVKSEKDVIKSFILIYKVPRHHKVRSELTSPSTPCSSFISIHHCAAGLGSTLEPAFMNRPLDVFS